MQCLTTSPSLTSRTSQLRSAKSSLRVWILTAVAALGLISTSASAQVTVSTTYPPLTQFLWGNSSVNAVGQTAFVNGTGWGYRYMTPKNLSTSPTTKFPVILYLCGGGEAGVDNTAQLTVMYNSAHGALAMVSTANPDNQTNFPCFMVAPQAFPNDTWSSDTAAKVIFDILNTLKAQYPNQIDWTRLYVTGSSLGGIGAYDLPYVLSKPQFFGYNPFAASVPMSGELGYYDGRLPATEPNMPFWVFHAQNDPDVPIATSADYDVGALRSQGFSVVYTRYNTGMHVIWELGYQHPQLLPWMFAQKLGQAAQQPLSNFTLTAGTQPTSTTLNLAGTASTAEGYTGISWTNTTTGQTGNASNPIIPSWSITNLPITGGVNRIQVTASAPNNTALVFTNPTNYGGTLTVNIPYSASSIYGVSNVALNKPAIASTLEGATTSAQYAVDGLTDTRWSSQYYDPQWIQVDLGDTYNILEVDLTWETACGRDYQIQISTDGVLWTPIKSVTGNTTSGLKTYPFAASSLPTGRYVRMYGTTRGTGWGYSLYEFAVYGVLPGATTPPPPPPPPPVNPISNLAFGKPTTVSSTDDPSRTGAQATDGNPATRWASAYGDPQWLSVDLGSNYSISQITLTWETAAGKNYMLQSSLDGVTWTTQTSVTGNTATGQLIYNYPTAFTARYVRMYGTARATYWGYSLWDFSVYGQ